MYVWYFSIQLACATHIPRELGGQGGQVIWLDTEGSLVVSRLLEVATATVEHCRTLGGNDDGTHCGQMVICKSTNAKNYDLMILF